MRRALIFGNSARLKSIAAIRTSMFSAGPVWIFDASDAVGSVPAEFRLTFALYDGISSVIFVVSVSVSSSVVVLSVVVLGVVVSEALDEVVVVVLLFVVVLVFCVFGLVFVVVLLFCVVVEVFVVVVFVFVEEDVVDIFGMYDTQ